MPLNVLRINNLKAGDKPYKVTDSGGLYLLVQPNGSRYWRLAYRFAGKQKSLSLGVFPDVGLADARERRAAARKLLATGKDPVATSAADKLAASATFRIVAEEWFTKCEREGRADITLKKQRWLLDFAYPKLADQPINAISAHQVSRCFARSKRKGFTRQPVACAAHAARYSATLWPPAGPSGMYAPISAAR